KYLRQMLGAQRDDDVLARLASTLKHLSGEPLELTFSLLMDHGHAGVAAPIRDLLLAGRAPRPDRAVRALSEWAGERAPAELASLLGRDPSLNDSVYARLREARKRFPDSGLAEIEAALSRLFKDEDRRTRRGAAQAAADLGLPLPGLLDLLQDR